MKLTIFVACFNEKSTILKAIQEAKNVTVDKEIIVIDNCSTDGTREILQNIKDDSIKIIFQPRNYGYGQSVKTGLESVRGEFIYTHQSDLEYDIECVYRMLELAEKNNLDYVLGSRLYSKLRSVPILSILKERPYYLGTLLATFLINFLYGRNFTDIIGTRLYRTSSLKKANIQSTGNSFDFEVAGRFCKRGFNIREVPVLYKPRKNEKEKKVKPMDIFPALLAILKTRFFN